MIRLKTILQILIRKKEAAKLTDEAYDFLEEHVTRAVEYMAHIRAHGRAPQNKDIGDYAYDIARYALEQYPDQETLNKEILGEDYAKETEESNE